MRETIEDMTDTIERPLGLEEPVETLPPRRYPDYADEVVRPQPMAEAEPSPIHTPGATPGKLVEVAGVPGYLYTDEKGVERVRFFHKPSFGAEEAENTIDVPVPPVGQDPAASDLEFSVKVGGFQASGAWGQGSDITPLERRMSVATLQGAAQALAAETQGLYAQPYDAEGITAPVAVHRSATIALESGPTPLQDIREAGAADEISAAAKRAELAKNAKDKAAVAGAKLSEMSKEVDWNSVTRKLGKAAKIWLIVGTSCAAFSTVEGIPAAGFSIFGIGEPNTYALNLDPAHDVAAIAKGPYAGGKAMVHVGKGIMHIVGVL